MRLKHLIAAAAAAGTAMSTQPAAAYPLSITGRTLASPQLAADLVRDIGRYSKTTGGCSFVFSVRAQLVASPASLTRRGGHTESWSVNACAARQHFRIAMWPSPDGGTDYVITPTTGRLPLHMR